MGFLEIPQSLHPSLKCFGTLFFFSPARQTLHLAPATPSVLKRKPSTFHSSQEWGYFHRSAADVPAWIRSPAEIMGHGLSPCPPWHLSSNTDRAGMHGSPSSNIGTGWKSLARSSESGWECRVGWWWQVGRWRGWRNGTRNLKCQCRSSSVP